MRKNLTFLFIRVYCVVHDFCFFLKLHVIHEFIERYSFSPFEGRKENGAWAQIVIYNAKWKVDSE